MYRGQISIWKITISIITEIQTKILKYHYKPVGVLKIKGQAISGLGKKMGKPEIS